jgi:hypothetical protein
MRCDSRVDNSIERKVTRLDLTQAFMSDHFLNRNKVYKFSSFSSCILVYSISLIAQCKFNNTGGKHYHFGVISLIWILPEDICDQKIKNQLFSSV